MVLGKNTTNKNNQKKKNSAEFRMVIKKGSEYMESDYEQIMQAYHEFQNYIYLTCHDKFVDAELVTREQSYMDKHVLTVCVRRRNYSTSGIFGSNNEMEYLSFLKQKHPQEWTELDVYAARAIQAAIKHFDTLDTQAQNANYVELYVLDAPISANATPLSFLDAEGEVCEDAHVCKSKAVEKYADQTNKKFPIDSETNVRFTLGYFGKSKYYEPYSVEERKVIAKNIVKAAQEYDVPVSKEWKDKLLQKSVLENFIAEQISSGKTKEEIKKSVLDKVIGIANKKYILRKSFSTQKEVNVLNGWSPLENKKVEIKDNRVFSSNDMKVRNTVR